MCARLYSAIIGGYMTVNRLSDCWLRSSVQFNPVDQADIPKLMFIEEY